mmetsp:Transcript_46511/g.133960  ORF Transcript_46511/g.133960 Transcript_46511/m.133960 type:complete len:200 (-) Transcript_46511:414-1013(-)
MSASATRSRSARPPGRSSRSSAAGGARCRRSASAGTTARTCCSAWRRKAVARTASWRARIRSARRSARPSAVCFRRRTKTCSSRCPLRRACGPPASARTSTWLSTRRPAASRPSPSSSATSSRKSGATSSCAWLCRPRASWPRRPRARYSAESARAASPCTACGLARPLKPCSACVVAPPAPRSRTLSGTGTGSSPQRR